MRREKNLETLDENHAEGSQMSQQLGLMTISRQEDRVQAEHKLWLYVLLQHWRCRPAHPCLKIRINSNPFLCSWMFIKLLHTLCLQHIFTLHSLVIPYLPVTSISSPIQAPSQQNSHASVLHNPKISSQTNKYK